MKPNRTRFEALLGAIAATAPREIDCDEFLSRVAPYLENRHGEPRIDGVREPEDPREDRPAICVSANAVGDVGP